VSMKIDKDWWKCVFDEIYLLTDARSVCNEDLTREEVDFLEGILGLEKSSPILDLCGGQGRHSLELSRRGFNNVTVLDYSQYLLDLGNEIASQEGLRISFVRRDARKTLLPGESYRFILIMASSFGYFDDEQENVRILQETHRLLTKGGTLLLDLPDKDYVLNNFKPSSSHQVNEDTCVSRERELGDDILYSREIVTSNKRGCIRDITYCTRLYSAEKMTNLLKTVGFVQINCLKGFMNRGSDGDFGCMTNRMIVTART
jgi:D-alanine-D-alanine ligase